MTNPIKGAVRVRKKSPEGWAIQYTGDNIKDVARLLDRRGYASKVWVETIEKHIPIGNWVMKYDRKGEIIANDQEEWFFRIHELVKERTE